MKKPKNIPTYYQSRGTPIYRDTTALPFLDGGPLVDKTNHGKLLNSVYASALGNYYLNGGPINTAGPRTTETPLLSENEMRAKMAYEQAMGNKAADRMLSLNPKTYDFGDGNLGTHYMTSIDNYAVPTLQDKGGNNLEYIENPPPSKEDFRFETPEQADYFATHYKTVAPMITGSYKNGGMLKRADGSYSPRGLWDNIRANRGSGKEPTKEMLAQEKKINREYKNGGQFPTPYSLPEDSFKQGGNNLHNSVYASSPAQYPAVYKYGGSFEMPRQQMYMPLDNVERQGGYLLENGGSILSMSNTPQLEGEGKDLTYPDGAYVYSNGGVIKTSHLFANGGPVDPPKLITYKNNASLVDGTANFDMISKVPISQQYNEQIKQRLYTGNYGFNPETGELVALTKPQRAKVSDDVKAIRAKEEDVKAYEQSVREAGVGDPRMMNPQTTWSDSQREEFIRQGFNASVNNPAFKTAAYFTPLGMAIGTIEGIANLAPDLYKGDYTAAAFDAAEMIPFLPKGIKKTKEYVESMPFLRNVETAQIPENFRYTPDASRNFDIEELRRVFHNGERILDMDEMHYLSKHGIGTRPTTSSFSQQELTNAGLASRWMHARNLDPARIVEMTRVDPSWRQLFDDYSRVTGNRQALDDYLSGIGPRPLAFSDPSVDLLRTRPVDVGAFVEEVNKPKNRSGLTKEQALERASNKEKESISKMSENEFANTILKPTGEIVPYQTTITDAPMHFDFNTGKMVLKDQQVLSSEEYAELFNKDIDKLNDIIAKNNNSGVAYKVKKLTPQGRLVFETPAGQKGIQGGETSWSVGLNPGKWKGEVEDIANEEYFKTIPGLEMRNTMNGVFSDNVPRRGTGTYESINQYLKELDLGRVKPGFNSQTEYSRGLWENAIQKGKGFGFYSNPRTVYGTMKSLAPYAVPTTIGLGAAASLENPWQENKKEDNSFKAGGQIRVLKSSMVMR